MPRRTFLQNVARGSAGLLAARPLSGALANPQPTENPASHARPLLSPMSAMLHSLTPEEILPGIWCCTFGEPETITPVSTRHYAPAAEALAALPPVAACPVAARSEIGARGCTVRLPLAADELVYGFGLQLASFEQRGRKKKLRVNADPSLDTGDSHAPVPFYVTTHGYGVLVDTARYATFYCGNKKPAPAAKPALRPDAPHDGWNLLNGPYAQHGLGDASEMLIEIPAARGVTVYIFAGPSLCEAVQRYNLFSGGGPVPPRWGLGFWYRAQTDYSQAEVLALAAELRERRMPCDVLGLEPHWQSHSYSCSYTWSDRFADPRAMLAQLGADHFRVNLWAHAFVHPSAPAYDALRPHAGDYTVWDGLVPDFLQPEARRIFAELHEKEHVSLGVAGYKLDECDNSDFTGNWSFPELASFPSGADGEQYHSLFGLRYQDAIQEIFERRRQRTFGLVRSSQALAAPSPYVLYSDLYDHRQFVQAVAQSSFSGLLWTPEVREASGGPAELVRRLQAVVFSPLAMVNAWYLKNPPWKQVDRDANNAGRLAPDWEKAEALCRAVLELRMQFIPYLHAAFVRYRREGLPPFRALVLDYPDDPEVRNLSDQFMMGDRVLVAPVIVNGAPRHGHGSKSPLPGAEGETARPVYLPAGEWYDFWTGERYPGRQRLILRVPLERTPLFVKAGTVLPLAQPTLHTADPASWQLTARVYDSGQEPAVLFEDDGSWEPALEEVRLEWNAAQRTGQLVRRAPSQPGASYTVTKWEQVG